MNQNKCPNVKTQITETNGDEGKSLSSGQQNLQFIKSRDFVKRTTISNIFMIFETKRHQHTKVTVALRKSLLQKV